VTALDIGWIEFQFVLGEHEASVFGDEVETGWRQDAAAGYTQVVIGGSQSIYIAPKAPAEGCPEEAASDPFACASVWLSNRDMIHA